MDKELYQTLVEQFSIYDKEDVEEILNDDKSSEEAIAAAKYILSGNSIEAKNFKLEIQKKEILEKEKQDNMISNPLYDDMHQLAGDIRFIKNIIIIGLIFEIINVIIYLL